MAVGFIGPARGPGTPWSARARMMSCPAALPVAIRGPPTCWPGRGTTVRSV